MSERMQIPAGERGVVRLFAVDLPPGQVAAFAEPGETWPLKTALGAETLDADFIEVFDAGDVAEIGLASYLIQGAGIDAAEIAADRPRLDALTGPLMVVTSGAFGGRAQALVLRSPLRWIGTWLEERRPVRFEALPDASARVAARPGPGRTPAFRAGRPAVAVLLAIALIVVAVMWRRARG